MAKIMVSIDIEGVSYDELREAMRVRSGMEDVARVIFHLGGGRVTVRTSDLNLQGPEREFVTFELIGVRP